MFKHLPWHNQSRAWFSDRSYWCCSYNISNSLLSRPIHAIQPEYTIHCICLNICRNNLWVKAGQVNSNSMNYAKKYKLTNFEYKLTNLSALAKYCENHIFLLHPMSSRYCSLLYTFQYWFSQFYFGFLSINRSSDSFTSTLIMCKCWRA